MWHEDLLAWQYTRQTVLTTPGGGGILQLTTQDPTRVYLSINAAAVCVRVQLRPWPVAVGDSGIPMGTNPTTIKGTITPGATDETVDLITNGNPDAPQTVTFLWPRDGILPQLAWGVYDPAGSHTFYILEVLMPNRPCPTWRANGGSTLRRVRLQRGNQPVGRGGYDLDTLAWPQCAPPGADLFPDES